MFVVCLHMEVQWAEHQICSRQWEVIASAWYLASAAHSVSLQVDYCSRETDSVVAIMPKLCPEHGLAAHFLAPLHRPATLVVEMITRESDWVDVWHFLVREERKI